MLVLNEIADDYEEPVHIHELLVRVAKQCGMTICPLDVRLALIDLIKPGWAKAYIHLTKQPFITEVPGAPTPEQADDYYYLITERGREVLGAFDGWPFNDDGEFLPDWLPPTE